MRKLVASVFGDRHALDDSTFMIDDSIQEPSNSSVAKSEVYKSKEEEDLYLTDYGIFNSFIQPQEPSTTAKADAKSTPSTFDSGYETPTHYVDYSTVSTPNSAGSYVKEMKAAKGNIKRLKAVKIEDHSGADDLLVNHVDVEDGTSDSKKKKRYYNMFLSR